MSSNSLWSRSPVKRATPTKNGRDGRQAFFVGVRGGEPVKHSKKHGIATNDPWLPLSLPFLRSRACAQLSPHASKLLLEVLGLLSTNANRNGDLSLAPKVMQCRGWSGRATLAAAVRELEDANLLFQTRQGGRKDCNLSL